MRTVFIKANTIDSVCIVKKKKPNPHHTNTHLSYSQMKFIIDITRLIQATAFGDQPVPAFPHPSLKGQEFLWLAAIGDDQGTQSLFCRI